MDNCFLGLSPIYIGLYKNIDVLCGSILNSDFTMIADFKDINEFSKAFDEMCSLGTRVKSSMSLRKFEDNNSKALAKENDEKICLDDFDYVYAVNVEYRQNASWQGKVKKLNEDIFKEFKSEMDLIKIITFNMK